MSKKITTKIKPMEDGMPISCTINYSDGNMKYQLICPKCAGRNFSPNIDRDRINCVTPDCESTIFTVLSGAWSEKKGVEWKL